MSKNFQIIFIKSYLLKVSQQNQEYTQIFS
jgi:hypothetical protein